MEPLYTLRTLEQVKALADPLRLLILEAFCGAPCTTKQVATRLGEKPTKLYHHVDTLAALGLLRLVETRPNRGTLEKYYQAVARQFAVDHSLLAVSAEDPDPTDLRSLLVSLLQAGLQHAQTRFAPALLTDTADSPQAVAAHQTICATPTQLAELGDLLQTWLATCQAADTPAGTQTYSLTVAFFPIANPAA